MNASMPLRMEQSAPMAAAADTELVTRIERYWSRRAQSYGNIRSKELGSDKKALWLREILAYEVPPHATGQPLRILDVGTGTGFFAILLAQEGHRVSAVDMCASMLEEAQRLAQQAQSAQSAQCAQAAQYEICFQQMDAAHLNFANDSFDLVLSRNLTWTLPDAAAAYKDWHRVLRPGGVLLNFDADYGAASFVEQNYAAWMQQHQGMDDDLTLECESIRRNLPLSAESRPAWDMRILRALGFATCACDTRVSERIFVVQDATYNPVPMFCLHAVK